MKRKSAIAVSLLFFIVTVALIVFCCQTAEISELSCSDRSVNAKAVYEYISFTDGKKTLSGQQESTWLGSADYEFDYIFGITGRYPVIRGFDYMNDDFDGVNARAYDWWKKGGIVSICWHCGSDFSGEWSDCMEDEVASWDKMLTPGTEEYDEMLKGMDKAAKALRQLQEQGVPVLWRPFHEFDGNWFWWSKGGAGNFKKLWRIMYERYMDHWQLDNLIWVAGFSDRGKKILSWYPGDEYCDIIGADTYQTDIFSKLYTKMRFITLNKKPLCLHECGDNPVASEFEKSPWSWFMTWHTEYLTERNSESELFALYNSEEVITLDEFDLDNY